MYVIKLIGQRDILEVLVLAAKTSVVKHKHLAILTERNARSAEKKALQKRNDPLTRLLK